MQVTTLGIDVAMQVFQVHGIDTRGTVVLKKRLTRSALHTFMAHLPPCRVGMEVCGGANYGSRRFRAFGHDIRLMSPQFVKPYVKSNKNDCNDAAAICEAASRPTMRFGAPKTVARQDMQGLHRIRQRLVHSRTALITQIRGLLAEYGVTIPQQVAQLRRRLPSILEDPANELTSLGREIFGDLARELAELKARILHVEAGITHLFSENDVCQRLAQVEGVGPLIATAIVA
ncbi:MAG: IS110 family transposase [Nitrospira sp.]|nr:IS110 family transposase [Nitrospira sp.]